MKQAAPESFQSITMSVVTIPQGGFMANLIGLASFVSELRAARTHLVNELKQVDESLAVLAKFSAENDHTKPRRTLSAAARRKISLAQKARWATTKSPAVAPKPMRHISASGKKRIAAAARARWAKFRAEKKKAA
jgi:hypothetical protein